MKGSGADFLKSVPTNNIFTELFELSPFPQNVPKLWKESIIVSVEKSNLQRT